MWVRLIKIYYKENGNFRHNKYCKTKYLIKENVGLLTILIIYAMVVIIFWSDCIGTAHITVLKYIKF